MQPSIFFLDILQHPLSQISQVVREHPHDDQSNEYWGGTHPIFLLELQTGSKSRFVAFTARDYEIVWRELSVASDRLNLNALLESFLMDVRGQGEAIAIHGESTKIIGIFDLSSVVSPIPGWPELRITEAIVVERQNALLGLVMRMNLGTTIGLFVTPNPGITLTFNKQCDIILAKALALEPLGALNVRSQKYAGRETPKALQDIDWFDWINPQAKID